MQRQPEPKALDGVADGIFQFRDTAAGLVGGFQHPRADMLLVIDIFVDRKNREQAVAHVIQHFTAVPADRGVTWDAIGSLGVPTADA